jgi:hypothetical protein
MAFPNRNHSGARWNLIPIAEATWCNVLNHRESYGFQAIPRSAPGLSVSITQTNASFSMDFLWVITPSA